METFVVCLCFKFGFESGSNQREFNYSNGGDVASLAWDYCSLIIRASQFSSTTRNLVPRFKCEVKSNFGLSDPYRVNYLVNNSGNEAEVSFELKLNKTSRAKYEGTIESFNRMDKRLIPEQSVRKGFRVSGIEYLSEGG